MKKIIKNMIERAKESRDPDLLDDVQKLINELVLTYNAPSDWRSIGEELAGEYGEGSWEYEQLELWNYED